MLIVEIDGLIGEKSDIGRQVESDIHRRTGPDDSGTTTISPDIAGWCIVQ